MTSYTVTPLMPTPDALPDTQARGFWLSIRKSLLEQIDAIERMLSISPRTSELRAMARQARRCDNSGV